MHLLQWRLLSLTLLSFPSSLNFTPTYATPSHSSHCIFQTSTLYTVHSLLITVVLGSPQFTAADALSYWSTLTLCCRSSSTPVSCDLTGARAPLPNTQLLPLPSPPHVGQIHRLHVCKYIICWEGSHSLGQWSNVRSPSVQYIPDCNFSVH